MSRRVMIVAGEASGDLHGARLVRELRRLDSSVSFTGMGGPKLREAGVELLVDAESLAVVGVVEVLRHWGDIQDALGALRQAIGEDPPDLLLLIDYVEFNLRLAKHAKEQGVPVLFYISPQVWAWRAKRVKTIGERVDHMAVVFPFEVEFYERAGIPVTYVGHPLASEVSPTLSLAAAQDAFGLDPGRPVVGLFPGSRQSEIRRLLPMMLAAGEILAARLPELQFLLPVATPLLAGPIRERVAESGLPVQLAEDACFYDVIQCCDAVATASGTATLELALMETPMAIVYSVAPVTYAIVRRLIQVEHIGLANIVAGEGVAREFVQQDARPEFIAAELGRLLTDEAYAERQRRGLRRVRQAIGSEDGSRNVARLALEMLAGDRGARRAPPAASSGA